jgi:hypothetical protein
MRYWYGTVRYRTAVLYGFLLRPGLNGSEKVLNRVASLLTWQFSRILLATYRLVRLFIADAKCTLRLVLSDNSIATFLEMLMQFLRDSRVAIHYQHTALLCRYNTVL